MNTELIKKKILDLAIRGKLVEQRPEEGTAEDLYNQIQEEKKKLIAEGKIKKEKPLPEITEEEIPFGIPDNWRWVRLRTILQDMADGPFGSNLKTEHYTNNREVRIIQLSNIGDLKWKNDNVKYTTFDHLKNISRSEVFPDDIVVAKMMPAGRAIIVPSLEKKYVLSSDAVRLAYSHKCIEKKWLMYAINSSFFNKQIVEETHGVTRIRTSLGKLQNYVICLPPLEEQKRIVDKVEEIFSRIDVIEKAKADLAKEGNLLEKKILDLAIRGKLVEQRPEEGSAEELYAQIQEEKQKLISEGKIKKEKPLPEITLDEIPFDIPESWKWIRLGDCVSKTIKRGKSPKYTEKSGTLVFAQKCNSKYEGIRLDLALYLDESVLSKYDSTEYMVDKDIVINSTGGGTMGRVGIYKNSDNPNKLPVVPDSHVTVIRSNNLIDSIYLFYFIKNNQTSLESLGDGSTNQTELKPDTLKELIVPLPPLAEQKRIVAKIEELLPYCDKLK